MRRNREINVSDREYGHIWRYLRAGRVTHALGAGTYGHAMFSRCGLRCHGFDDRDDWFGTGTQSEYEQAASLPRCLSCLKAIGRL